MTDLYARENGTLKNINQNKKLEETKLLVDKLSTLYSHLVWNMDTHSIMTQLEETMQKEDIPAIVITDNTSDQTFSIWKKDKKILYGMNIDITKQLKKELKPITKELIYREKNLGDIKVYIEQLNDFKFTNEEKEFLKNKKDIRYCVMPGFEAFEKIDKNGNLESITNDYMAIISNKTSLKTKMIKEESFMETLTSLRIKKCDMILGIAPTKSRNSYLLFTDPFLDYPLAIVTRLDENYISNTKDIIQMKIGIPYGHIIKEILRSKYDDININQFESTQEAFEQLSKGKIDCYIDFLPLVSHAISQQGAVNLKIAGQLEERVPLSVGSRSDEPLLNSILNKVINSISDTEHKHIMSKWIRVQYEENINYDLIWKVSIVLIIIIGLIFYWNITLKKEIERRKQIEHKLALAKEKAEEASKSKSSFLANMSHEIRTPMNAVIGMNTLALKHIQNKMAKDYVEKSLSSAKSLLKIINEILDFSKIEAGKLTIENIPFDIREKVQNTCEIFNYAILDKELNLYINIDDDLSKVYTGDPLRIGQILSNFLSNAIKFTLSGNITVTVKKVKNHNNKDLVYFSVADTGMGIGKSKLSTLFESFEQESSSTTRNFGGTGLGLAICKKLTELMDGNIGVNSTIGIGSTFYFQIPLEITTEKSLEQDHSSSNNGNYDDKSKQYIKNSSILLVEDFHINVEIAVSFIRDIVDTIDVAKNGKEAIEILEKKGEDHYKLVLMDIQMPIMDGYETTEYIRDELGFKDLPIIAMSANAMQSDIDECLKSGMNDHIPKPFDVADLINKINKWILKTKK